MFIKHFENTTGTATHIARNIFNKRENGDLAES